MFSVRVFAEDIAGRIKDYLPKEYETMECQVIEKLNNNGMSYIGLRCCMPDYKASPVIDMDEYYQDMRRGEAKEEILRSIAGSIQDFRTSQERLEHMNFGDYDAMRSYLRIKLVNTKANWKLLTEQPHREIEDLSMVLYLQFSLPWEEEHRCMEIMNGRLKLWGIDQEELWREAYKNMQEKSQPTLKTYEGIMSGERESPASENLLEAPEGYVRDPYVLLYMLSNGSGIYGAASLVCPGVMEKVSLLFPEGFYILPSSVHEALIVPRTAHLPPQDLGRMVREVNQTAVPRENMLSDRVYEYDQERGKIRQIPESLERGRGMER